ncbi:hypothetical protein CYA_0416 [Synechococcus sp. JA-3-3Ab]|nr:hypothetical protein CYA_0416 [Synechococcus sp. JA-3-3Ab]
MSFPPSWAWFPPSLRLVVLRLQIQDLLDLGIGIAHRPQLLCHRLDLLRRQIVLAYPIPEIGHNLQQQTAAFRLEQLKSRRHLDCLQHLLGAANRLIEGLFLQIHQQLAQLIQALPKSRHTPGSSTAPEHSP